MATFISNETLTDIFQFFPRNDLEYLQLVNRQWNLLIWNSRKLPLRPVGRIRLHERFSHKYHKNCIFFQLMYCSFFIEMEDLEQYFDAETGDIPLGFAWKDIYPSRKLLVVNVIRNEMGDTGVGLLVKSIMHSLRFCVVEEIVDEPTSLNAVESLYNMLGRPLTVGLYDNHFETYSAKDFSETLTSYITAKEAKISCRIGEEPINAAFFNFPQSISEISLNFEVLSVTSLFQFFNSYKTLNLDRYSLTLSIHYGKNGEFFDRYVQWCQNLEEPRDWFRNVKIKHADAPYIYWKDFPKNRASLANQRHTYEDSQKPKWTYFANLQSGYQLIIHLYTILEWKFFSEVRTLTVRNHTCEFIIEEV